MVIIKEELNSLRNSNPVIRNSEKVKHDQFSPFDPPNAYNPQNIEPMAYEKMHLFLQSLIDEHRAFSEIMNKFEESLFNWRSNNWIFTDEISSTYKRFFIFFDEKVQLHNQKEEKILFPLLHKKLIESGEHNSVDKSITGINLMEDEHLKVAQAVAIVFNFLGLGSRLSNKQSKEITYQAAFEQGLAIVETMKLHIFREENILFPQTMKLFTEEELKNLYW